MQERWQLPPGDKIIHRPRREEMAPVHLEIPTPRGPRRNRLSYGALVWGFILLIVLGTLLLISPWATNEAYLTPPLIALFTATSAVCVTGLIVVDTASYWTPYGQVVIALLMILGGLGIMTTATLLFIAIGRRITLANRLLIKESLGTPQPGGILRLVRNIVLMALGIQVIGFGIFGAMLWTGTGGLPANSIETLWMAGFHSISAFNNAGFDIFPHPNGTLPSIMRFQENTGFLAVTILLAFLGAISFTALRDMAMHRHHFKRYLLDTKLVLSTTAILVLLGTVVIFSLEISNPGTFGHLDIGKRALNSALFSSISRTSGFSTVDFGAMKVETSFFMTGLMFIGGASASIAGGIKINTFAVLLVVAMSSLSGKAQPEAFGRSISPFQVYRALVVVVVAATVVFAVAIFLTITEDLDFFAIFFETVSAFGTVGLTRGITSEMSGIGQGVLILTMYFGRIGPLALALVLAQQEERSVYRYGEERVKIG